MSWADLENACVTALEAHKAPAGPFRTVKTYGGELGQDAPGEGLGLLPAALVMVKGGQIRAANAGRDRWREELTVSVMAVAGSPAGDAAVRHGSRAVGDVGLYALVQRILTALVDLRVTGFQPLLPAAHRLVERERERSVYAVEFTTSRTLSTAELRGSAVAEDLERIGTEFNLDGDATAELASLEELE